MIKEQRPDKGKIYAYLDDFEHYDSGQDGFTAEEFTESLEDEYQGQGIRSRAIFHIFVGTDADGYTVPEFVVLARNADSALETGVEYYNSHLLHVGEDPKDINWEADLELSYNGGVVKTYSIDEWLSEFTEKIEGEENGDEVLEQTEKVDDTKLKDAESGIDKIEKVQKNTPEIKVENKKITMSEFKKLIFSK